MSLTIFTSPGYTDLYGLFQGTDIALAAEAGTGLDAGWYTIPDSEISSAGLSAGIHNVAFLHGDVDNPSANDPLEAFITGFTWNGSASLATNYTALTSKDEMERLFSRDAIALRTDDAVDADDAATMITEIIEDATGIMMQYLWDQYATTDLVLSSWVRRRATYVAAYLLSQRRGNPDQYIDRFNMIIEELNLIRLRKMFIPNLNVLVTTQPTMSNYVIDNRGLGPVQRVAQDSVGTYPGQRTTLNNPYPEII